MTVCMYESNSANVIATTTTTTTIDIDNSKQTAALASKRTMNRRLATGCLTAATLSIGGLLALFSYIFVLPHLFYAILFICNLLSLHTFCFNRNHCRISAVSLKFLNSLTMHGSKLNFFLLFLKFVLRSGSIALVQMAIMVAEELLLHLLCKHVRSCFSDYFENRLRIIV